MSKGCMDILSGTYLRRLQKKGKMDDIYADSREHTFNGVNQQPRNLITFHAAIKLIMRLPGINAGEIRDQFAKVLRRYFAGDPTLVFDIIDNNMSSDDINQAARDSADIPQAASREEMENALETTVNNFIASTNTNIQRLNSGVDALQIDLTGATTQIQSLELVKTQHEQTILETTTKLQEVQTLNTALNNKIISMDSEIKKLKDDNGELLDVVGDLKQEIQKVNPVEVAKAAQNLIKQNRRYQLADEKLAEKRKREQEEREDARKQRERDYAAKIKKEQEEREEARKQREEERTAKLADKRKREQEERDEAREERAFKRSKEDREHKQTMDDKATANKLKIVETEHAFRMERIQAQRERPNVFNMNFNSNNTSGSNNNTETNNTTNTESNNTTNADNNSTNNTYHGEPFTTRQIIMDMKLHEVIKDTRRLEAFISSTGRKLGKVPHSHKHFGKVWEGEYEVIQWDPQERAAIIESIKKLQVLEGMEFDTKACKAGGKGKQMSMHDFRRPK